MEQTMESKWSVVLDRHDANIVGTETSVETEFTEPAIARVVVGNGSGGYQIAPLVLT